MLSGLIPISNTQFIILKMFYALRFTIYLLNYPAYYPHTKKCHVPISKGILEHMISGQVCQTKLCSLIITSNNIEWSI